MRSLRWRALLFLAGGMLCAGGLPMEVQAAKTAQGRIFCTSVRFARGTDSYGMYTLDLTMLENGNNGELIRNWGAPQSHFSYLTLKDDWGFEDPFFGAIGLNVPTADANGNGWADFFEVARPVNTTSSGVYQLDGWGSGNVTATWSREAGQYAGTCKMTLQSVGTFTHTFEVLEYEGLVTYTPGATQVNCSVEFARAGYPYSTLSGPINFLKDPIDPFNTLDLKANYWTNEMPSSLHFIDDYLDRDPDYPTNYYGFVEFDDFELATFEPDFCTWTLSIDDPNDTDKDGIPDFSDTPGAAPAPGLTLLRRANDFLLTISGQAGRQYTIQEAPGLTGNQWTPYSTVTLSTSVQGFSIPLTAAPARFWRVVTQ